MFASDQGAQLGGQLALHGDMGNVSVLKGQVQNEFRLVAWARITSERANAHSPSRGLDRRGVIMLQARDMPLHDDYL
ncbi:MAG: hypothetical protein LBG60_10920 [Bifidobacteriaceae bacterium]|nr:hypothetical protein [Bifidobacteriaceae bacterium]